MAAAGRNAPMMQGAAAPPARTRLVWCWIARCNVVRDMKTYKRILAAIDFTDTSRNALEDAAALAKACHAQLEVLHVQPDLLRPHMSTSAALPQALPPLAAKQQLELREAKRLEAEERLEAWVAPYKDELVVATRAELGDPQDQLLDASREVDLIVLGAHQRSAARDLFEGSVERKVAKKADCPVLLVPEAA